MSTTSTDITTVATEAEAKVLLKNQEQAILAYEEQANTIKAKAESVEIVTADDLTSASSVLTECNKFIKEVEDTRKWYTDPVSKWVKHMIWLATDVSSPVETAKEMIKGKILAYNTKMEEIRKAEEERIRKEQQAEAERIAKEKAERDEAERQSLAEENEKLKQANAEQAQEIENDRIRREFEAKKIADAEAEKQRLADQEAQMKLDAMKANAVAGKPKGMREVRLFEVTSEQDVPRSMCKPDESLIREAVKAGAREIPWVRIYSENRVQ